MSGERRDNCVGRPDSLRTALGLPDDPKLKDLAVNPKTVAGSKKAPLHLIPPVSFIYEARVYEHGAAKYKPYNWRESKVPASIYYEAALRHLMAWWDGEDNDPDSGQPHFAHVRACMGIVLDAAMNGRLEDDRPPKGASAEILRRLEEVDHE